MKLQSKYNFIFLCLIVLIISSMQLGAQDGTILNSTQKKLLIRDSLDFKNKILLINTSSNEFSPIPYKSGLLYISNKPLQNEKVVFNKIYWTKDSGFKIIDKINTNFNITDTTIRYIKKGKSDDYTAPTSNDNDILVKYKKIRSSLNSVEFSFSNFSTDQAFAYDDSTKLLIYAKKANRGKDGIKHWSLWQASFLNGKLKRKKRIEFTDKNADYLYPFFNGDGSRLYFSSNIRNGQGGYDIFYVNMQSGAVSTNLVALSDINSKYDEIAPSVINDTLFFSSNREGGLGGFDAYYLVSNTKLGVHNIGYPVNSERDEVGIKKAFGAYFLTTNRTGNFDILNLEYLPITFPINGILTYRNDGSLAPNHLMYLKDKEAGLIIDSITTDNYAKYSFTGKPNREYEFTTLNGDSLYEQFVIQTVPKQLKFDYISYINGRSPKQKADSVNALWVFEEKRKLDSVAMYSMNTKFVVHYDFDKSIISNKEKLVLDSLINKLSILPNVFISVGAFTDCIGSYKYNYSLSVKRGKAVVDYLIKHGLDKQRIIANGYSKKYTISPCITKYTSKNKTLQQDSRRAEIVLSENKKTDWATLELERGKNYYAIYNSSNAKSSLIANINKDSIRKTIVYSAANDKKNKLLKAKLERIRQDSIKIVKETIVKGLKEQAINMRQEKAAALAKMLINKKRVKDSIINLNTIIAFNIKKEQFLKSQIARAIQDSVKAIQENFAKQALLQKLESQKIAKAEAKIVADAKVIANAKELRIQDSLKAINEIIAKQVLAQKLASQKQAKQLAVESARAKSINLVNELRIIDSINKEKAITALKLKNENLLKVKLERIRQDSIVKADFELIAQVAASKKKVKDSLNEASLKAILVKPNADIAPNEKMEEELSKEEILKSLEILAKLKQEQDRIVAYLTKRINKKPIDIFVNSDSVTVEIYDNAIHDKDSVSIIFNNRIIVDKQELKVNQPIKFSLKVDKNKKLNELVMIAENLGSDPPNTAVMFVTEKSGRRQQILLSTDLTHNEVVYFIRIGKE